MKYITLNCLFDEVQYSINHANDKNPSLPIKNCYVKMRSFISHNEHGVLVHIHDFSDGEEYVIPEHLVGEIEFEVNSNPYETNLIKKKNTIINKNNKINDTNNTRE